MALEYIRSTQSNQRPSSPSGRSMSRASDPSDMGCANSAMMSPPPLRTIGSSSLVASASRSGRIASIRGLANSGLTSARYTLCSGGSSSSGSRGYSRGCVGGMSVVPGTADVNASQSSAAAVTSS